MSSLYDAIKDCEFTSFPTSFGNHPVRLLCERSTLTNPVALNKEVGMLPCSLLKDRFSVVRLPIVPTEAGMLPVRLFLASDRNLRFTKPPTAEGITPSSTQNERSSVWRLLRLESQLGIERLSAKPSP